MISALHANTAAVNFENLPSDAMFKNQLSKFLENSKYMSVYTYKWDYSVSKDNVIADTISFESTLSRLNTNLNSIDLCLLHIICLTYMYNLDVPQSNERASTLLKTCIQKYPNEYRFHWINGNFLCSKTHIQDGIYEFIDVLRNEDHNIQPEFLEDFAYNCMLSNMCFNGIYALNIAAEMKGINVVQYPFYKTLKEQIIPFDVNKEFPKEQIWIPITDRNKNHYFTSTALGTSIPINSNWKVNYTNYSNHSATLMFMPERIKAKNGNDIGISMLIHYDINNQELNSYINNQIKGYTIVKKEQKKINNNEFEIFYIKDDSKYPNMGGARGIIAFTEVNKSFYSNVSVEFPMNLPSNDQGKEIGYFRPKQKFDRTDAPIKVCMVLDSCNDVFVESNTIFTKFMDDCIFE
jgi:hypothetical protein